MQTASPILLVVEDDRDIREALIEVFEGPSLAVESCEDGIEALERLRRSPAPRLVILDLMMPRLDGFGVLSAMKEDPELSEIPVVVLSASMELPRAIREGASAALAKPIDLGLLTREIEEHFPSAT